MDRSINIKEVHNRALTGISQHASIGRIPFYDYVIELNAALGEPAPSPKIELVQFLENAEPISESPELVQSIDQVYAKYRIDPPIGIYELPRWWACGIVRCIESVNWVEPDYETSRAIFGWSMVHLQGAFLDIQMIDAIKPSDMWHSIAGALWGLHVMLEPGPYTPVGRLPEFI